MDINEYGRPYPFEARYLPNYPLGFPIVIEDGLSQHSVQYVLKFLTKGNFHRHAHFSSENANCHLQFSTTSLWVSNGLILKLADAVHW